MHQMSEDNMDYEMFRMNIDPSSPFEGMIDCSGMLNDKNRLAALEQEYNKDIVMQEVQNTKNKKVTHGSYFTTADLIHISEKGIKHNYNRVLEPDAIRDKCDPCSKHVLVSHFIHEGRSELPPHYRCVIMICTKDSSDPIIATFDVDVRDFNHYKNDITIKY